MKITALILAGGEGSRMAGQDKGLQLWHGLPLIDHVLQTIAPQVQHTLISANRHLAEYALRSYPVLSDDKTWQGLGPLAALATLAEQPSLLLNSDWLLVVPCDTPQLPETLVVQLSHAIQQQTTAQACYAITPEREHYSIFLVHSQCLKHVAPYLQQGGRSIRGWLQQYPYTTALFEHETSFKNMNTMADLQA